MDTAMNIVADVEIHFHEQEKVSIFHEMNCTGNDERCAEIALCTSFAIRMMCNLGQHEITDSLATVLNKCPDLLYVFATRETALFVCIEGEYQ